MYFIAFRKNKIPCVAMHYILDTVVSASIPRGMSLLKITPGISLSTLLSDTLERQNFWLSKLRILALHSRLADVQPDGHTHQRIAHNTKRQSLNDKNIACE